jgi:hypothetical protein
VFTRGTLRASDEKLKFDLYDNYVPALLVKSRADIAKVSLVAVVTGAYENTSFSCAYIPYARCGELHAIEHE